MPLVRSSPATVSEGWAPCSSQWRLAQSRLRGEQFESGPE